VQDEKWDFYNSSRLVELTYPLKLLESQGKKLLGDYLERSVKERNSERKKEKPRRRRKRWGNREDGDTPAFIHVALRTARRISVHPSIETRLQPSCTWYPALRKIGFSCAFPQFKLSSRRRKNWISAPCDALHHLSLPS